MSDSCIVVGCGNCKKVHVYTRIDSMDFEETIISQRDAWFGRWIDILGDTVVVRSGRSAYIYKWDIVDDSWSLVSKLGFPDEARYHPVAIGNDFVVVGDYESDANIRNGGAAHVFVEDTKTEPPSFTPTTSPSSLPSA